MLPEKITLKSGATLDIQLAPFAEAMRLFKTIANELKSADVQLDGLSMEKIKGTDINGIKNAVLQLLGSDAIEASVRTCMVRCLYNGTKITPQTFEPNDARQDYLPVAWEVVKFNMGPFFAGLDLSSLTSAKPTGNALQ
jgi:hypothetical protein